MPDILEIVKQCKMKMDTKFFLAIDYFPPLEGPPHFVIDYAYLLHYTLRVSLFNCLTIACMHYMCFDQSFLQSLPDSSCSI